MSAQHEAGWFAAPAFQQGCTMRLYAGRTRLNLAVRAAGWALLCCLAPAHAAPASVPQNALIYAESGPVSPLVESVVNSFQSLLRDSTIIVLSTDGDEQQELSKLASFLQSRKVVVDAPQIIESVRKQLRRDKSGFAHPIWLTEHSAQGNACVLAVRQNEPASYTTLVSKKIDEALISGKRLNRLTAK